LESSGEAVFLCHLERSEKDIGGAPGMRFAAHRLRMTEEKKESQSEAFLPSLPARLCVAGGDAGDARASVRDSSGYQQLSLR